MTPNATETQDPPWALDEQLNTLAALDPDELRGTHRLGALAFESAPEIVERIIRILRELRLEPWDDLPQKVRSEASAKASEVVSLTQEMLELSSDRDNAQNQKNTIEQRLNAAVNVFVNDVRPHCRRAPAMEAVNELRAEGASPTTFADSRDLAHDRLAQLQAQADQLEKQIRELDPLVQAQREAVGESAAEEFSTVYSSQAAAHRKAWKLWLGITGATIIVSLVGGSISLYATHETDPTIAEAIFATTVNLLVIGILLFAVRVASHQFRVHRHLEVVAEGKAAALTTFNRLVQGQTDDVRTTMASVLSQAVFASNDTGFIDGGGDHVTLIERVVGPAIQRGAASQ